MNPVRVEKLVFGGQALARTEEGVAFLWNALPGEDVVFETTSKRKGIVEGTVTKVQSPSKDRIEPIETSFLSTSPWQIMTEDAELRYKQEIAAETYSKLGDLILSPGMLPIATDGKRSGYRNKMEFSFTTRPDGSITLAFFERGKRFKTPVDGSILAEPVINTVAADILHWIQAEQIPIRSLKALLIRSNGEGGAIAALFIKDRLEFATKPLLQNGLLGFTLYYSTHKSPASVPTDLLYTIGQETLTITLKGANLEFGIFSFFQINPPVFDMALTDIAAFTRPKEALLDFYAGVGAIGIPLSGHREKLTLVESNAEAVSFATKNLAANSISGGEAICLPAEEVTERIDSTSTLILDPPRAGLHPGVVTRILRMKPPKVIYLSCGIDTQARDLKLLSESYRPIFFKLYNFFPQTPHIEGLVVLEKI